MKFSGYIFDFNGVLWWDRRLQDKSWNQFSEKLRGTPLTPREMDEHVHGRNNSYAIVYLLGKKIPSGQMSELIQEKESMYRQLCLEEGANFRLSLGATALLNFLKERDIPRTIVTASEKINVDFFVEHLHLGTWFDPEKIVLDDGKRPGKPEPDSYLEGARRIGKSPHECVVTEDSKSGIESARRAGIGYIVALGSQKKHDFLKSLRGVNQVITSFEDLDYRKLFE